MREWTGLRAARERYDAVLCDLWGVVHDGRRVFLPALEALVAFRERGGRVVLLSNVPKTREPIPGQLDRLGVPRAAWDAIVTSGDAIRAEFAARAPGPMHLFGPPEDGELWEGLRMELSDLESAAFLAATGLNDFERDEPAHYRPVLARARARGLVMLCANPDIVVRLGKHLYWCAGALAQEYTNLGGEVVLAGKPHAPIYELAFAELRRLLGREPQKGRVLAIGDGPGTDILGANRQGLDSLFVARGIHGHDLGQVVELDLSAAEAVLANEGVRATYGALELH